ncbi:hypothetical protein ABZ835_32295 [Streptomyces sp. NPDC047461]|uniref:hypothetical protein n=1 Tax=Streptomyces sp. NPDC047461 TaxID=3155619 RepID=UPI0033C9672E
MSIDTGPAQYADSVAGGAEWLLLTLGTPGEESAAVLLADRARRGLDELPPEPQSDLDTLGQATAGLAVACTLLAADRATGPGAAPATRAELERSIARLTETSEELDALAKVPVAGFAPPVAPSPTVGAATERLRRQSADSLSAMAERTLGLVGVVLDRAAGWPKPVADDALVCVGAGGRPGAWLGELAALTRRVLLWVLDRLDRLLPVRLLPQARRRARQLVEAEDRHAAIRVVLGVTDARLDVDRLLSGPGLDRDRLDRATAELLGLDERFDTAMRWVRLSVGAITVVAELSRALDPLLTSAALYMTVLCATVVVTRDYVDSGRGLGLVHGVRSVVADACEEHSREPG